MDPLNSIMKAIAAQGMFVLGIVLIVSGGGWLLLVSRYPTVESADVSVEWITPFCWLALIAGCAVVFAHFLGLLIRQMQRYWSNTFKYKWDFFWMSKEARLVIANADNQNRKYFEIPTPSKEAMALETLQLVFKEIGRAHV